jgi:flavin reductase (DIM6/NTAB) family NADH-FMN oxidoreductase RutF
MNISPLSSLFALEKLLVLGLGADGQGLQNIVRTKEAVVSLPSEFLTDAIERIAPTTGRPDVPSWKAKLGYIFEADKFRRAGLTRLGSEVVLPSGIDECPVNLETRLVRVNDPAPARAFALVELEVVRVSADVDILIPGSERIDVSRWRPLFYVFRHYFGLGAQRGRNFRAEVT